MELIALPYQKQFYTYLPASNIYGRITVADLPISFHNLLNQQNGGYCSVSYSPSPRPSRDALNAVNISYIAGMFDQKKPVPGQVPSLFAQDEFFCRDYLAANKLIFFEDQGRCAYLGFDDDHPSQHPWVGYYDHLRQQEFGLADSFDEFLSTLEDRHFHSHQQTPGSYHIGNQLFLKAKSSQDIQNAFSYGLGVNDDYWLNLWRTYLVKTS
ncbi:SMI1/KNR4 family protein [Aerococcus kribbianus]|uniref:SMI1/KNR4 family protein n=1 Tax=Aerococcus kribbianus TaxID=2999064 RepID=A0A9X3FQT5_9LACT|nr:MULTISPECIES: SMI1/KNR4 family protein [unclassified Aerococcus]MCZ0717887.1 SMI1/KNR4 family protein [Aerococcus sp. YH-aer221]MCZ0726174.1 SMI1/KNR4 family protein [Aerococcus sp. YH-aer222]